MGKQANKQASLSSLKQEAHLPGILLYVQCLEQGLAHSWNSINK
jgi:hypothetical protein